MYTNRRTGGQADRRTGGQADTHTRIASSIIVRYAHDVDDFSIPLLPRGLHRPKCGTGVRRYRPRTARPTYEVDVRHKTHSTIEYYILIRIIM